MLWDYTMDDKLFIDKLSRELGDMEVSNGTPAKSYRPMGYANGDRYASSRC